MHVHTWLAHLDIRIDQNTTLPPVGGGQTNPTPHPGASWPPNEMSGSVTVCSFVFYCAFMTMCCPVGVINDDDDDIAMGQIISLRSERNECICWNYIAYLMFFLWNYSAHVPRCSILVLPVIIKCNLAVVTWVLSVDVQFYCCRLR